MPSEIIEPPAQAAAPQATAPEAAVAGDTQIPNPDSAISGLSLQDLSALQDRIAAGTIGSAGTNALDKPITLEAEPPAPGEPAPVEPTPAPTEQPKEPPAASEPPKEPEEPEAKRIRVTDPLDQAFISLRKAGLDPAEAHRRAYGETKPPEAAAAPQEPTPAPTEAMRAQLAEIDTKLDEAGANEGFISPEIVKMLRESRDLAAAISTQEALAIRDAETAQKRAFDAEVSARQAARASVVDKGYADANDAATPLGAEVARLVVEMQAEGKHANGTWVNPVLNSAKAPKLVVLEAAANINFVPTKAPPAAAPAVPIAPKATPNPTPLTAPGSARTTAPITITPAQALEQLKSLTPEQQALVMQKAGEKIAAASRAAGYR